MLIFIIVIFNHLNYILLPKIMLKYTGGEIIAKYLIKEGVKYVIGIPGHGNLPLVDAFFKDKDKLKLIQPKQEMSGVHLAVGYYRVTRQPLCVFTSIGPGAINTAIGVADAFVDSFPCLIITGDTHVHMRGKGVLQEIERKKDSGLPKILEPIVKRSFEVDTVGQLPTIMQRALSFVFRYSSESGFFSQIGKSHSITIRFCGTRQKSKVSCKDCPIGIAKIEPADGAVPVC